MGRELRAAAAQSTGGLLRPQRGAARRGLGDLAFVNDYADGNGFVEDHLCEALAGVREATGGDSALVLASGAGGDATSMVIEWLLLVAGHAGWPDVQEMLLTAARHPGVFLEFSSHRPRHMPKPGSGWEPLLHHARGMARDRVLFGTSTWVNPGPTGALADELAALELPAEVVTAWLSGNAEAPAARAAGTRAG